MCKIRFTILRLLLESKNCAVTGDLYACGLLTSTKDQLSSF